MHILFLAQTPPPVHGAALINQAALDILKANPAYDVTHLDISASKSISDMQQDSLTKIFKSFSLFFKICLATLRKKQKKTYINVAPFGLASIRDFIFLTFSSWRSTEVIAHFHGQLPDKSIFIKLPKSFFRSNITFIFLDTSLVPINFLKTNKKHKILYNFAPNENLYKNIRRSSGKNITVGFLANMLPAKGIECFLESCALELRSGYTFSVLVAGTWTAKYNENLYLNWLDDNSDIRQNFFHYGPVNNDQKHSFFKSTDIFLYPTKNDAFPLVLLEAMASGSAILASDVGAIRNIITSANIFYETDEISTKLRILLDDPIELKNRQLMLRDKYYSEYSHAQFKINILNIFGLSS